MSSHPATSASSGTTLLELVLVLSLLGLLTVAAFAGADRLRDAWGVDGAQRALAQLLREARGRAVARGGARVLLTVDPPRAVLQAGAGAAVRDLHLGEEFGVAFDLGGPPEVELLFDAAGVGRMTARTLGLTRGRVRGRLVVSAYGRVRR